MVSFIKRDKKDIYSMPILGFLFKNSKFLFVFRVIIVGLFFWAIYLGFKVSTRENLFTPALFWGIFWSFFMVLTLPTFGRIFCGICPHGFLGKYITKYGLKRTMPKWLQNRYIGIFLLVVGWWGVYYMFPGIYKTPYGTAMMFLVVTILAFVFYFLYKDMSYCKYICPIGTLTRAYSKLSFTKLGSYESACKECKTFDCATACPYNLKPFTFNKRNSMTDCTLCMECANSCEAIHFKITKPAESLEKKFQPLLAEVWIYLLILASIPISMSFAHGLNRSKIADSFIWNQTAEFFHITSFNGGGFFAWLYAILFTLTSATVGLWIASKILKKDFKYTFGTLGYAFAPLFILGSLSHTLSSFFTRGYDRIVEGFLWGFGFGKVDIDALAHHGDKWLLAFGFLKWIAVIWSLVLLYKRFKLIDATTKQKVLAYPFAAFVIIFFLSVNIYRGYIFKTYGTKMGGMHGMHMMHMGQLYQSVPKDKAIILQHGKDKTLCSVCGMKLHIFYKTNHAANNHGKEKQYCSIHCLYEDMKLKKAHLKDIKVVDTKSLKFIPAKSAYYVIGSKKSATMSEVSKYAFATKKDAQDFVKKYGGKIVDFDTALKITKKDFQ
ncbi:MAG: 4Fe-4S binding protein [Epsilonproteobacteria bacterium]|nr:4Fe-4S binding protein [Campylobacterota bacterium]